jgi:hypothetical protein
MFPNFENGTLRFNYNPSKLNPRLTRGGPLARDPAGWSASADFNTGNQKPWTARAGASYGHDRAGSWQGNVNASLQLKLGERVDMTNGPSFDWSLGTAQYVSSVGDATATATFGRRYLFADIRQKTLSIDSRTNITLSPRTTIEIYAQPFISSGDYDDLKELRTPRTYDYTVYGKDAGTITATNEGRKYSVDPDGAGPAKAFSVDNKDFNVRSLIANTVFRWEWRPGSTLFLVWQSARDGRVDAFDPVTGQSRVGNFQLGRDTRDLFDLKSDNVFMVKLTYWLNP